MKDYTKIIPRKFHGVSFTEDVPQEIREIVIKNIQERKGLYIWGATGTGKTHIVCAFAKLLLSQDFDVRFFNTGLFLETLRTEFNKSPDLDYDDEDLFMKTVNFKGVLILDDIGAEKVSEWVIERLYLIINKRDEDMLPTIFTSNFSIEALSARLGQRIASRIRGMTYSLEAAGVDMRLEGAKINNE